jgi:chromosome partitioning protein
VSLQNERRAACRAIEGATNSQIDASYSEYISVLSTYNKDKAVPGKVVSVLNMKGGVGKTTVSAHVMYYMYSDLHKKVLLVDLDPQFNLTQTFIGRRDYDKIKLENKTIFAAMEPPSNVGLLDVKLSHKPPPATDDLVYPLRRHWNPKILAKIDLIPGNFDLVKYSLVPDKRKLDKVMQRFLQFISQAKSEYDLIVIDCNPSSSFITLAALHACSSLLVPVKGETYSMLGLEMLDRYVSEVPSIHPKPDLSILINTSNVPGVTEQTEAEIRAHRTFGPQVLVNPLPYSRLLTAKPRETGFATQKGKGWSYELGYSLSKIVAELAGKWGL